MANDATRSRLSDDAGTRLDERLLLQLRRAGLDPDRLPNDLDTWQGLLERVSASYVEQRHERQLLERALDGSSIEMRELYEDLRRVSESQVAAERDKLRAVIDGFSDGFCTLDREGRLLDYNPSAETMLGTAVPIAGQPVLKRFRLSGPAAAALTAERLIERVFSGGGLRDDKALLLAREGRMLPVSLQIYPIVQEGRVTGCALTFRDLTELQRAELSSRRLALAVDASADAIYLTDLDGVIQYVNPAFTAITGWRAKDALGRRTSILRGPDTPRGVHRTLWETIAVGKTWSGRLLNLRRQDSGAGVPYWAQTTIAPIRSDSGRVVGYVAVQRDVSREVLEAERQERETRFAHVHARVAEILQRGDSLADRLGDTADGICSLPGIPFGDGVLVIAGDASAQQVLFQRGSVADARPRGGWSQGLAGQTRPRVTTGPSPGILISIPHGGRAIASAWFGLRRPVELDPAAEALLMMIAGMIGVAIADDRARHASERARQAALDAVDAKSRFLANMSHEIRTPMNGVLGMLDMLARTELGAEQRSFVQTASASADSLLRIINDILDFSKIEAGKLDLEHIPFDVRLSVEEVVTLFSSRAKHRGLRLLCSVPPDVPTLVVGDPTRLQQVLNNIVDNAIKFTEAGGVELRLSALEAGAQQVRLLFEIKDTGVGMSKEQRERLFQPFVQADGSTTRRFGGTGLGLAISRQLVELMGGEINVDSESGQGSRFWFSLPYETQSARERDAAQHALEGLRLLAVDDNAVNRDLLAHYLHAWKVDFVIAENPIDALAQLRDAVAVGKPFEVAILDMQMPYMDGLTLGRRIKSDPATAGTRLLMLSSLGANDSELRSAGFHFVMAKPLRQSVLHDALMQMRGLSRPGAPSGAPGAGEQMLLRGRVLLAEDNVVNQQVALGMLDKLGLVADVAEDGLETLERLAREQYDLILMDCQMPLMDGYETTRRIRVQETATGAHLPVVALTANAMPGDRERCLDAGMDDYIAKPIKLNELFGILSLWLPAAAAVGDGQAGSTPYET